MKLFLVESKRGESKGMVEVGRVERLWESEGLKEIGGRVISRGIKLRSFDECCQKTDLSSSAFPLLDGADDVPMSNCYAY